MEIKLNFRRKKPARRAVVLPDVYCIVPGPADEKGGPSHRKAYGCPRRLKRGDRFICLDRGICNQR